MTDDNLSDTQKTLGSHITWKNNEGFPVPTFYCSKCNTSTEGFSLCLKCNPQSYNIVGNQEQIMADEMSKASADRSKENVYATRIWNEAIEAVANNLKSSYPDHAAINAYCAAIRSLKK